MIHRFVARNFHHLAFSKRPTAGLFLLIWVIWEVLAGSIELFDVEYVAIVTNAQGRVVIFF